MEALQFQAAALMSALAFCIVRAVVDFHARRAAWAGISLLVAALLVAALLAPIETRAVKVELVSFLAPG